MYEYITGRLAGISPTHAVIEAGGVGYYLNISLQTFSEIEKASETLLYVHFIVREDMQVFYGFSTWEEREVFRRLISVSGVGGNTARTVLSTYSPEELASIISSENAVLLKNVKGLGLKTAEKIIVELRDKMIGIMGTAPEKGRPAVGSGVREEAVAALAMLGFAKPASEKALHGVIRENPDATVEEVIRLALKKL